MIKSKNSKLFFYQSEVRWVITVPAIWRQQAKQFMREAAYQAGIGCTESPEQVLIALEPEAASVYYRKLKPSQLVPERQKFAFSSNHAVSSSHESALVLDDSGTGNQYLLIMFRIKTASCNKFCFILHNYISSQIFILIS